MKKIIHLLSTIAAFAGAGMLLPPALAESAPMQAEEAVTSARPPVAFGGAAVDVARLDGERGGDLNVVKQQIDLDGTVSGATVSNVSTGHNVITDGSFANAAGFPIAIQNSGNNVLIQNATNVILQVK